MRSSANAAGVASIARSALRFSAQTWDAVVIGGGPAGAIAGYELVRRGLRTIIIERKKLARYKVCGGCLNADAVAQLDAAGLSRVLRAVPCVPLQRLTMASGGRHAATALPGGCIVSRDDFDQALLGCATEAGAALLDGASARIGDLADDAWSRHVDVLMDGRRRMSLRASVVINAAGLGAMAAMRDRPFGERVAPHSHIGLGAVVDGAVAYAQSGTIWMAIGQHGYVGIVRLSDGRLNVGAAVSPEWLRNQPSPSVAFDRLVHEAGLPPVPSCAQARWHGTPALTRRPARVAAPRLLLIGDAAGYVEPFTGQGMAWAIQSARAAANIARAGVSNWTLELEHEWNRVFRATIANHHRRCRWLTAGLRSPVIVRLALSVIQLAPRIGQGVARLFAGPGATNAALEG